jgi:hypothetical protein
MCICLGGNLRVPSCARAKAGASGESGESGDMERKDRPRWLMATNPHWRAPNPRTGRRDANGFGNRDFLISPDAFTYSQTHIPTCSWSWSYMHMQLLANGPMAHALSDTRTLMGQWSSTIDNRFIACVIVNTRMIDGQASVGREK